MNKSFTKRLVRLALIFVVGIGVLFLVIYASGWALARANSGDEELLYICTSCLLIFFILFRILGIRRIHRLLVKVLRLD